MICAIHRCLWVILFFICAIHWCLQFFFDFWFVNSTDVYDSFDFLFVQPTDVYDSFDFLFVMSIIHLIFDLGNPKMYIIHFIFDLRNPKIYIIHLIFDLRPKLILSFILNVNNFDTSGIIASPLYSVPVLFLPFIYFTPSLSLLSISLFLSQLRQWFSTFFSWRYTMHFGRTLTYGNFERIPIFF